MIQFKIKGIKLADVSTGKEKQKCSNTLKAAELYTHTHTHTHTQLKRCLAFLFSAVLFVSSAFSTILPSGYTELEYIENQGDSCIDTGIITDNRLLSIDFDFQLTDSSFSGNRYLVGVGNYGGDAGGRIGFGVREGYWMNIKPGTNYNQFAPVSYDRKVCNWTIDGSTGTNTISGDLSNSATSLQHFGYNLPEQKSWRKTNIKLEYLPAKIYSVKIKLDNLVVRNLIPAKRNTDGEIGMYDTVNDVFYTNSGTGSFTAGPEINYTELEYIELNHAYIDTGIVLDTAQKINTMKLHYTVANVAWVDSGHSNHLLGCRTNVSGVNNDIVLYTGGDWFSGVPIETYFGIRFGTTVWRLDASTYPQLLNRYRYDIDNLQETITDVETNTVLGINTATAVDWACITDLRINGLKGHTNPVYAESFNTVRVYDFEIEGIAHMIPAKRNTDGVVGMYDTIRNQFYTQTNTTGYNNPAVAGPEVGIIGDTCTYATIMGENICLIDTQPSGSYLPVKYNNNKYYLMLDATHDYPIHKNSDNKLKVIVGNTTYNAHDTSVLE